MSYDIPTVEPDSFFAGDTIKWTKSLPDFPASDSWTLKYTLIKEGSAPIAITSSADGDDHAVSISKTTSADYLPGLYTYQAYVEDSTDRYSLYKGTILIEPNISLESIGYDLRSFWQRVVDGIKVQIENALEDQFQEGIVGGERAAKVPMHRLTEQLAYAESRLEAEIRAQKIKEGKPPGGNLKMRFI